MHYEHSQISMYRYFIYGMFNMYSFKMLAVAVISVTLRYETYCKLLGMKKLCS